MTETIYRASRSRPEGVLGGPIAVVDRPPGERARRSPEDEKVAGLCGGPGRNSRSSQACPPEDRVVAWSRSTSTEAPSRLLATGERCLVWGTDGWALHDPADGRAVVAGPAWAGAPCLWASGALLVPDGHGMLDGIDLETGERRFWISPFMANLFERPFTATVGETLVVGGVEREPNPESGNRAELSSVEVWPVHEPLAIGPNGQLRPGYVEPVLFETTLLHVAAWPGGIVTAEPGRILHFSLDLEPTAALRGEFEPVALSLDEEGWVYLLVDEAEQGPRALWVLNPEGGRTVRFVLPQPLAGATTPPAVDYGHRIILVGGGTLLALAPAGGTVWKRPARPAGDQVVVAADDTILLSEGSELVAFDRDGERRILFGFEEELCTPPALTPDGKLLVASREALHCLVPHTKAAE